MHSANSKLLANMSEDESQLKNHHLYYSQIKRLTHHIVTIFCCLHHREQWVVFCPNVFSDTATWSSHLGRHG